MAWVIVFAIGVLFGAGLTWIILQKSQRQAQRQELLGLQHTHQAELTDLIQTHEAALSELKLNHKKDIDQAKQKSLDASRSVIKGQIAEQIAPYLPNFKYLPSDARFIGDPIDFLVINGYTNLKDGQGAAEELEVVLVDIKSGKAKLSDRQVAIENSVRAGRVRFETIRINLDQLNLDQRISEKPPAETQMMELPTALPESLGDALDNSLEGGLDPGQPGSSSFQRSQQIAKIRQRYPRAYEPWEAQEDFQLGQRFQQGQSIQQLATQFQRQPSAIQSRLRKLKLLSSDD
ncbi:Holliday junction resolvase-like protein [Thermosynechococcaceae cyanobacterium BACA0444]|uniref:Holliday junction resolvase-like protein n=1 Tax=Pseudocalidococcus azoricus BACA0444 TaxID=2918990 RepID=A0AAE4K049_9CYAN|nr:Holliday junction resolvase-like protein [Pseudocalidococcus azoricus]MDS3861567.1 Holliday junction resolvase-like protein [Pseudocalidococcus azoricus BACA0444]